MRLFHASFDRLTPAQLQQFGLWPSVGSGVVATTGKTGQGVTGTTGATAAQNSLRTKALGPLTTTIGYQGFALKCVTLPVVERQVWALLDTGGTTQLALTVTPAGLARLYRGTLSGGTLLATSPSAVMAAAAWRYLQIGYDFTADTLILLWTASGVTSVVATNPGLVSPLPWSAVEFALDDLTVLDDFYVNDATTIGSLGNAYFSGETGIVTLGPSAEASTGFGLQRFYPNTGSDKAAVTDDDPCDLDATYAYSREANSYLLYQMDTLTDDGRTVDDVQAVLISRAVSSAWAPEFGLYWRRWDGYATYSGRVPLTWTNYQAQRRVLRATAALGGAAWTVASVNDSRFGVGN